jgi:hypothetical protein
MDRQKVENCRSMRGNRVRGSRMGVIGVVVGVGDVEVVEVVESIGRMRMYWVGKKGG